MQEILVGSQLGIIFNYHEQSPQSRIQLSIRGDFFSRRMRAKQGGTRLGDLAKHDLLLRREALHGLHQIGDQVRPPLQNDVHLRPRGIHRLAFHGHLISTADKGTPQHQRNYHQNNQNHQNFLHVRLESVGFTNVHSSRAAIPAWESDAPAHPGFFPIPSDTHCTSEQFPREIRPSGAPLIWRRMPACLNPSAPPLAQRYHARPPAALLQKQSPHGAAASALRKTIFSRSAPVPSHFPARADNAASISAGSCASHAQSARDAGSSALRFPQRRPLRRALAARASYPESRSRRRSRHPSAHLS